MPDRFQPKSFKMILERRVDEFSVEPFEVYFDPNYPDNRKLIELIKEKITNG